MSGDGRFCATAWNGACCGKGGKRDCIVKDCRSHKVEHDNICSLFEDDGERYEELGELPMDTEEGLACQQVSGVDREFPTIREAAEGPPKGEAFAAKGRPLKNKRGLKKRGAKWDPQAGMFTANCGGSRMYFRSIEEYDKAMKVLETSNRTEDCLMEIRETDLQTGGTWVKISAVADSGAEVNALPEDEVPFIPLTESEASKVGKVFRGAGGQRIPAKGKRVMHARTAEGQSRRVTWEVCPVRRPLLSVAKMTKAGNVVLLDERRPRIINTRTGEVTALRRERNVFMVDMWVWKPGPDESRAGFPRRGA